VAFCSSCGSGLQSDARFCPNCGRETISLATTAPQPKRSGGSFFLLGAVFGWVRRHPIWTALLVSFAIGIIRLSVLNTPPKPSHLEPSEVHLPPGENPTVEKKPELPTEDVMAIVYKSYESQLPSPPTDDPLEARRLEKWRDARESSHRQPRTPNCVDDNCYRMEYSFNIMDLKGDTHVAECDWDVDATRHLATPLNGYARYYFTPRRKRKP